MTMVSTGVVARTLSGGNLERVPNSRVVAAAMASR